MSAYELHQIKTTDGLDLAVRHYLPSSTRSSQSPERTIMIVHGLSEHAGRYDHVARYFVNQGWNIVVPDQRGHGESSGPSVHAPRFEAFCDDLQTIREYFKLAPERLGILGHSMGGLISTRDAQLHPEAASALLLSSPLLGLIKHPSPVTRILGKLFTIIYPTFLFSTGFSSGEATSNPEAIKKREADPYVRNQISANLFFEIENAIKLAWRDQKKINVPVKVLQAADDYLVDPTAAMDWFEQYQFVAAPPCEGTLIADHLHELLNETDWELRCEEALAWFDQHVGRKVQTKAVNKTSAG